MTKTKYITASSRLINESNKYMNALNLFVLAGIALFVAINSPAIAQDNKGASPGPTSKPISKPASKSKKTPGSKPVQKTASKPAKNVSDYESYLLTNLGILDPAYARQLRKAILEKKNGKRYLEKLRRKVQRERRNAIKMDEKGFLDKARASEILIRLHNRAWVLGKFKELYHDGRPPKWFTDKRKKQAKKKAAKAKPKNKAVPKISGLKNNTLNVPKRKVFLPPASFRLPKLGKNQVAKKPDNASPPNSRYLACKQLKFAFTQKTNITAGGFLQHVADTSAQAMSCIHENTAGSAPFFDRSLVDISQEQYRKLNHVVKLSMKKLEGRRKLGTKKKFDYTSYLSGEYAILGIFQRYSICKAAEKTYGPGGNFDCETKDLQFGISYFNKDAIDFYNLRQAHHKNLKLNPPLMLPNFTSRSELISFVKSRNYEPIQLDPKVRFVRLVENRYEALEKLPHNEEIYVELLFEDGDPPHEPREVSVDISGQIVKLTAYAVEANLFRTKTAFELNPDQAQKVSP